MNSSKGLRAAAAGIFLAVSVVLSAAPTVRLKDIATLQGIRGNQLVGVGLVTGLAGRGDSANSALLRNAVANLVSNFGFRISPDEVRSRNCAVVSVSAEVPPFLRPGASIDVTVASLGDARSLEGGVLLQAPLKGANGRVYALAQGQVFTIGEGSGTRTVGNDPGGGHRRAGDPLHFSGGFQALPGVEEPGFPDRQRRGRRACGRPSRTSRSAPRDAALVELEIPEPLRGDPVGFIARLEAVQVTPDPSNKVVIDAASGIIIFGEQVRIGKVAVSYKDVSVKVGALAAWRAEENPDKPEQFTLQENTTVEQLVDALRTVGLDTETVIQLIKAIDKAGSLYGTLVLL